MDFYKTLAIAAVAAVIVIAIWFGRLPAAQRARTASAGRPNAIWWLSLSIAVVVLAYAANQLPDLL